MFLKEIIYLLFLFTGIFIFYLAGSVVIFLAGYKNFSSGILSVFLKLVAGCTAFVVVYSSAMTSFKTVNAVLIVVGLMMIRNLRKQNISAQVINDPGGKLFFTEKLTDFIPLILYSIIWFFLHAIHVLTPPVNYVTLPLEDFVFYSNISGFMNITGNENPFVSYSLIAPEYNGVFPYHYYDLWLASGYSKLSGEVPLLGLLLFSYPLLQTLCTLGLYSIISHFFKPGFLTFLAGILLIAVSGADLFYLFPNMYATILYNPKYAVIYLFLIIFILCILKEKGNPVLIIPLLILAAAYSVVVVAIFIFLSMLFLFSSKLFSKRFRTAGVIVPVFSFLLLNFLLFYLFKVHSQNGTSLSLKEYSNSPMIPVNIAVKTIIQTAIIYFVFALPLFFIYVKEKKVLLNILTQPVFKYAALFILSSLLSWMLFYPLFDSAQFFSNIAAPLINLSMILLLLYVIKFSVNKISIALMIIPFAIICIINWNIDGHFPFVYSEKKVCSVNYFQQVDQLIKAKKIPNMIGAYAKTANDYTDEYQKNSLVFPLGGYLSLISGNASQLSISVFEIPVDTNFFSRKRELSFIESTPFYKFVQTQKKASSFQSIPVSQLEFIKKNKLGYLIVSPSYQLPDTLKNLVDTMLQDSYSGERFYVFKN